MRSIAFLFSVAAAPAFAHDGLHLHPHGIDGAWAFLALAVFGAGAIAAYVKVRK